MSQRGTRMTSHLARQHGQVQTGRMGAARDPELRDVPAVAVCATCGDPSCPGHDFEQSGERPIRRVLPWEDGLTPPARALWRTAMATASDLDLWIRASLGPAGEGVGPAFTFALACELVAVAATCVPLAVVGSIFAWKLTHNVMNVYHVIQVTGRVAAVFVPLMLVIHVVHQWVVSRSGARLGRSVARTATLRAGLYACGWDLATGPAGILAPLFLGKLREARKRMSGNSNLFRDATSAWLRDVHGVTGARAESVRRATLPYMAALVLVALLLVAWAFSSTF